MVYFCKVFGGAATAGAVLKPSGGNCAVLPKLFTNKKTRSSRILKYHSRVQLYPPALFCKIQAGSRRNADGFYRETKKRGFADYKRTNRTTHLVEPSSVISRHFPVGHRHCVGSRMGQRVVGQLLVVGPERSVGTCVGHHLRHLFPPEKPALFSTSMAIPWLYDLRFRRSPDDLLRSQLSARWHAQLCQFLTKSLLSGIAQAGFCK